MAECWIFKDPSRTGGLSLGERCGTLPFVRRRVKQKGAVHFEKAQHLHYELIANIPATVGVRIYFFSKCDRFYVAVPQGR